MDETTRKEFIEAKDCIVGLMPKYLEFVIAALSHDGFKQAAIDLVPFTHPLGGAIDFDDGDKACVKSLGFELLKMDNNSPIFSMAVTIDIPKGPHNSEKCSTTYLVACKTLTELKQYAESGTFAAHALMCFERELGKSFNNN